MLALGAVEGGVQLAVRAQPKASRNAVVGLRGERLKIAVTAAPEGGKANRAVEEVLADALGVRPSAVAVVLGQASRDKVVCIRGLSVEEVRGRLERILGKSDRSDRSDR